MVVLIPTLYTPASPIERNATNRRFITHRRARALRVLVALLVAVAAFCIPADSVDARTDPLPASSVKAAFVYQFANFVEWPENSFENSNSPLKIGVVGDDELLAALRKIVAGKKIGRRSVEIVTNGFSGDDFHDCHILFIGANDQESLSAYIEQRDDLTVLAVSDSPNFTRDGGIIRLYGADKKIGIEINIDAAKRAKLHISSKLLRLATVVHDVDSENR